MKLEIANHTRNPSKPGMGLAQDYQAGEVFNAVPDMEQASDSDISGFDWNQNKWMFNLAIRAHLYRCGASEDSMYANLCYNLIHLLANSVYLTSDGKLLVLEEEGVMNSGAAVTSWLNSLIRAMLGVLVGHLWILTMGDDAVHDWIPDAKARYERLGVRVKNFDRCPPDHINFCSHQIFADKAIPTGVFKSMMNILSKPYDRGELADYVILVRHHPEKHMLLDILVTCGWANPEDVEELRY
jgi:hypothetical protein